MAAVFASLSFLLLGGSPSAAPAPGPGGGGGAPGPELERALSARVSPERMLGAVRDLVELGPRMGGTPSGDAAADWLAARFREAGLEVEIALGELDWSHHESSWAVRVHGADGGSFELESAWPWGFSPPSKGRARLGLRPEKGAALLASRPPARGGPLPAVVLVDGAATPDGRYPVVHHLGRGQDNAFAVFGLSGPDGERVRSALEGGSVLELEWELEASIARARPRTVVARLASAPDAEEGFLLYCAHGDSDAGGPGANDNASGVAVVLEIARVWAAAVADGTLPPPAREVRFAVWGSEIASTRAWLAEHEAEVAAVINYDQAGFGSGADQLHVEPDDLPANVAFVRTIHDLLTDHAGTPGFPERWVTNKSLGGTDSYVFSDSEAFRREARPAVTLFASAWGEPQTIDRTAGMPGESWNEGDRVTIDGDVHYHSAGDTAANTVETEPWNMAWCARAGWLTGLRWLGGR